MDKKKKGKNFWDCSNRRFFARALRSPKEGKVATNGNQKKTIFFPGFP
jgi:hypothetical protein